MLHILDAVYENEEEQSKYPEFLAAIGVGFPDDETGTKTASYQVNLVDLENWLGTDEDDEGEDVD